MEPRPHPAGGGLGRLGEHALETSVERTGQHRDRAPRLVESPLRGGRDLPRRQRRLACRELARMAGDVRQLLREPVVQVARQAPPLLERGRRRAAAPVGVDLARRPDEQEPVEPEPEQVTGRDPVRVERREQEVVQRREGAEDRAGAEPAQEIVARLLGSPRETDGREHEEDGDLDLRHEQERVVGDQRLRSGDRRVTEIDRHRQLPGNEPDRSPDHGQRPECAGGREPSGAFGALHRASRDVRRRSEDDGADEGGGEGRPGAEGVRSFARDVENPDTARCVSAKSASG